MLLLIPVFLLLIAAIALQVLSRWRFSIIQSWVFSISAVILVWFSYIGLRILNPTGWTIPYIKTNPTQELSIVMQFSSATWVFGFLLLTLLLAVILADSNRLPGKNNLLGWSSAMVITASAVLACMSASLVAFLLACTFLDITLFVVQMSSQNRPEQLNFSVIEFALRIIGSFLLMAVLGGQEAGIANSISEIPAKMMSLVLLGLTLRIGIFSIGGAVSGAFPVRKTYNFLTLVVVPITIFALISRLPALNLEGSFYPLMAGVVVILTLINLLRFYTSNIGSENRIPWIAVCSGLGLILVFINREISILPLGIVMLVIGNLLSVNESATRNTRFILAVLMIGLLGLKFTPSVGIWIGKGDNSPIINVISYNLILFLALSKALNSFIKNIKIHSDNEKWIELSTGLGPILLVLSPWVFLPWTKLVKGQWIDLVMPILIIVTASLLFLTKTSRIVQFTSRLIKRPNFESSFYFRYAREFFQLKWLSRWVSGIYNIISGLVKGLVRLLEGDGGLLWAFVFLILLTTVIYSYQLFS